MRFVVNDRRQVMGQYTYSPFGACAAAGGEPYQENGLAPLYRFAGEPWSTEAGLTYLRARQYGPTLGRFLTRDPFQGFMAAPQTLNPYAYAGNNPVNLTDPSGLIAPINPRRTPLGMGIMVLGTDPATGLTAAGLAVAELASSPAAEPLREQLVSAANTVAAELLADGDPTNEIQQAQRVLRNVCSTDVRGLWGLDRFIRGGMIHDMLGQNLPRTFLTIDRFAKETGEAVSIKTMDMLAKTSQRLPALTSRMTGYVDKLSGFTGHSQQGIVITSEMINRRVLLLAISPEASPEQLAAMQQLQRYAAGLRVPVDVVFTVVPF